MSSKICLKVMCPFEDCEHHFHRPVNLAASEFVCKQDCKDYSPECSRYQTYYQESVRRSLTSDLAVIQHFEKCLKGGDE